MLNNENVLKLSEVESIGVTDEGKLVLILNPNDKFAVELLKAKNEEELFEVIYRDALSSIFSMMSKDVMKESIIDYISDKYTKYGIDNELIGRVCHGIKLKFSMLLNETRNSRTESIKINTREIEPVNSPISNCRKNKSVICSSIKR